MSDHSTRVLPITESRLDWLTGTAPVGSRPAHLAAFAQGLLAKERLKGNLERPFYLRGYQGQQCGAVRLGERGDGTLIQLSGDVADEWGAAAAQLCARLSRVDMEVTVLDEEKAIDWAQDGYLRTRGFRPHNGRPPVFEVSLARPAQSKLAIGRRTSEVYRRLYDKTAESRGRYPARSWRYEVELKGEVAAALREPIAMSAITPADVQRTVSASFAGVGVPVTWLGAGNNYLGRSVHVQSDIDRTVGWLHTAVRGSVSRVVAARGEAAARDALGLHDEIATSPGEVTR